MAKICLTAFLLKYLMFYSLFKDTDLVEHIHLSSRNTFFFHAGALFFLFCLFAQRKRNVKIQRHTETQRKLGCSKKVVCSNVCLPYVRRFLCTATRNFPNIEIITVLYGPIKLRHSSRSTCDWPGLFVKPGFEAKLQEQSTGPH